MSRRPSTRAGRKTQAPLEPGRGPEPRRASRGSAAELAGLALAAVLLWLPSLHGEFIYDDVAMVVNNPVLRDPGNLVALLRFDPTRPLLTLSWVLSHAVGGFQPWAFRLPNILLHAGTAVLAAWLAGWLARARGDSAPSRQALVAGLFFACTPMATETVAYVASRSTGLCAFLGFAFLSTAVREIEATRLSRRLRAWALLLLAHASKEEAAAFPVLLVLLDLFGPAGGRWREVVRRWRLHVPFLALPVLGFVARRLVVGSWLPNPTWPYDLWLRTQAVEFPGYLLRALVPLDPAFHRGTAASPWPPGPWGVLLLALLLSCLVLVWWRPFSKLSFAISWMAVALFPSSTIVPLKELVVDHRAYTGGFGAAFAAAGWLAVPGRAPLAAAALVVMSVRTLMEQRTVSTSAGAWENAAARAPEASEARLGLGLVRLEQGRTEEAIGELQAATRLTPRDARAWSNLSAALRAAGRAEEAVGALERALPLLPGDARLQFNLGVLYAEQGQLALAEERFSRAAELDPPLPQAMLNAATLKLRRGDTAGAQALLDRAAGQRLTPDSQAQLEKLQRELARRRAVSP